MAESPTSPYERFVRQFTRVVLVNSKKAPTPQRVYERVLYFLPFGKHLAPEVSKTLLAWVNETFAEFRNLREENKTWYMEWVRKQNLSLYRAELRFHGKPYR